MLRAIIVNYNMPEATDRLVEWVGSCIVVDNGSHPPYRGADVRLPENRDTMGGILAGLHEARRLGADVYWLLSTSMIPIGPNPVEDMENYFTGDVVGVSPMWTGEIQSLAHKPMTKPGRTKLLNTFSAWKASWLDEIGWFDPRLTTGWGSDFETSFLAREHVLLVADTVRVRIQEGISYRLGRIQQTWHERQDYARDQMNAVLGQKYGHEWRKVLAVDGYI